MGVQGKCNRVAAATSKLTVEDAVVGGASIGASKAIAIDIQKYQEMIDNSDLSEDQKRQVVVALWSMIVMFIDLGFNLRDDSSK